MTKHSGLAINTDGWKGLCIRWMSLLVLLCFVSACSVTKYIPEDKYLSTESDIEINNNKNNLDDKLESDLKTVLKPTPNSRFLGGYPGLYYFFRNKKKLLRFINKRIYNRIGEKPVYYSEGTTAEVEALILNRLENRGYFHSTVESNVEFDDHNKEAKATYKVQLATAYRLNTLTIDSLPSPLNEDVIKLMDGTFLKDESRFDLNRFKAERQRIKAGLIRQGYYNFNEGFLIFEADTNQYDTKQFDLVLKLKDGVPRESTVPYTIDEIVVYPNQVARLGREDPTKQTQDTVVIEGVEYVGLSEIFRPDRIAPFITMGTGKRFDGSLAKATSRRLSTIGAFRFVNIQHEVLGTDSLASVGKLKTSIELSALNRRSVRAELQAVSKSNSFAGPVFAVSYANRNLFNGGETLNVTGDIGYEVQVGNQSDLSYNLNFGLSSELIFPRLILPFSVGANEFKYDIPKTRIKLSIDQSNRSGFYKLLSGSMTYGYDWNAAAYVTHTLNLISINYNNLYESSQEFLDILDANAALAQSFDQQFIAGLNYSFIYNELLNANKKGPIYFNFNLDMAGNLFGLLTSPDAGSTSADILGLDFAQYLKSDIDFRYHIRLKKEKTIAMRLFGGYAVAYGNSDVVPFIKQYHSGGPYSLRAFNIRGLGPGTYETTSGSNSFFEQTGNIKLEGNVEFRFPIYSYLKGAVFADVGNIWLLRPNASATGGEFSRAFLNQLGMGAGVGLRVDVQGFVVRFDFAVPFHSPEASLITDYSFNLEETKFNFAIGYPF